MPSHVRRLAALVLAVSASSLAALAQEGDDGRELPPLSEVPGLGESSAERMVRLFQSVERNLQRIDARLNDAGAGDVPLDEVESAGLDDLLRRTQDDGRTVVADIDRILELAQRSGGSCSKCLKPGSGAKSGRAGAKPKGGEPGRSAPPRSDEATPLEPGQESDARPSAQERPESPEESLDRGENSLGRPFDRNAGDPASASSDADAWGLLPPKVQGIFRNEGTEDVPVQYRDWIDAYYRRLSASRR